MIGVVALINNAVVKLPPEVGKIVAWKETQANVDSLESKVVKHEYPQLKSCKEFFTQEQLDNSGKAIQLAIHYDLTYCLEPEQQVTSKFSDYTNSREDYSVFYYGFRTCQ